METKLSYICICPWAKVASFLSSLGRFVPFQIFPSRDGRLAVVEFAPDVVDVYSLVEKVESFKKSLESDGKENN